MTVTRMRTGVFMTVPEAVFLHLISMRQPI